LVGFALGWNPRLRDGNKECGASLKKEKSRVTKSHLFRTKAEKKRATPVNERAYR